MRRIISVLIAAAIILSLAVPVFAAEPDEPQFGTMKVEYSDARGKNETLAVMVQNGYVYANMLDFSSRLGFVCEQNGDVVSVYNNSIGLWELHAPALAVHYRVGSTEVSYNPLFGMEIAYTAPCPIVENDQGVWIPLSYTLYLLGGSHLVAGDVLVIQMPSDNVLSIAARILYNESILSFAWQDFGYSETTSTISDGAARVVTLFSGLLEFDGSAWSAFVDWNAFEKKFGKSMAAMICTTTADELQESIDEVETMLDVFDDEGALGSMLRSKQMIINSDVDAWQNICQEYLEQLKTGSGTLPQYNMAYRQYERAVNEQDLFAAVGGEDIIHIQDELATATTVLDRAVKIGYAVSYLSEFQQRDAFRAKVLTHYVNNREKTDNISDAFAKAMGEYASSNIVEYTLSKFCQEHLLEILVDESGLDALMGMPANILLLAWDIMSGTIPFYRDGLKAVEQREISNYAQQLQADAMENMRALTSSLNTHASSLTAEDCAQLSEYCYIYLKASYIARSAAIASLENVSEETRKKIQDEIDVELDINAKIVKYLAVLSRAEKSNECYILGFLPKNQDEYLNTYSDKGLIEIVYTQNISNELVTDVYFDYIIDRNNNEYCYHIPQINLREDWAKQVNQTMFDHYYGILVEDVYSGVDKYGHPDISEMVYGWGYRDNLVSVVVRTDSTHYANPEFTVYTFSTATGREASIDELLAVYGMGQEKFYSLVRSRLKQSWDERRDLRDTVGTEFFDDRVSRTLAESNIKNSIPFINSDGGLSFVANIYSLAAGDCYLHLINAEGEIEMGLQCTVDHSAEKTEPSGDALQYFIENCDRQYFTEADVKDFDHQMCVYARNAVFAKSGRIFQGQELQEYFAKYSWYVPRVEPENFSNDMLNTIQRSNVDLILDREEELEIEGLMNSLDGEEGIYTRYLHNGGYEEILGSDYDKNALEISTCLVDLDYDGTDELFLSIETGDRGIRGRAAHTLFLDIKGDKVFIAAETYFGGGSMGGDHLVIKYDRDTKKHVLALDGHIRAGVEEYTTYLDIYSTPGFNVGLELVERYYSMYYDWYRDVIDKIRSETTLYYMDEYDFRCYQIDEQYVTKEAFDNAWARYEDAREGFQLKPGTYAKPIA